MVRSVQASKLISWVFGVALRAIGASTGFGLMFILGAFAGFSSAFIPSCANGFDGVVGCAAGGGVELLEAGPVEGNEVGFEGALAGEGPPSFASRFARIWQSSACVWKFTGLAHLVRVGHGIRHRRVVGGRFVRHGEWLRGPVEGRAEERDRGGARGFSYGAEATWAACVLSGGSTLLAAGEVNEVGLAAPRGGSCSGRGQRCMETVFTNLTPQERRFGQRRQGPNHTSGTRILVRLPVNGVL